MVKHVKRRNPLTEMSAMFGQKALKLVVLCLVAVATVKLLLPFMTVKGRQANGRPNIQYKAQRGVWGHIHESSNLLTRNVSLEAKEKHADQTFMDHLQKAPTEALRVVHLDLKGAAPKVEYLKQIFPLFSSLGASGILLEYEDMFPYERELQVIKSPFAYSIEEIEEIKSLAKLNKLELIPLVQVFGHLEFVLKHEKYFHLREVAMFPNSLNPLAPGALSLVEEMLSQVLRRHPEAKWIHIGADEVWGLGESEDSKRWLKENGEDVGALFLKHVSTVCLFLAELRSGIKILFWEDMLREMSAGDIKASHMPDLAFPVLWNYLPSMNLDYMGNLLSKYQDAGFSGIWFASAFKGASEVDQIWTPINHHLQNHLSWLKVIESVIQYPSMPLQGIALTGWQRYRHHLVLCELFPVAIPSLAVCLQTLKYGSFNNEAQEEVHHILGCKIQVDTDSCEGSGQFAGSHIFYMVHKIHSDLQSSIDKLMKNKNIRGSLSSYNRKYNFANPRDIGLFKDKIKKLLDEWVLFLKTFEKEMEAIFYADTVEEWLEENVNQHINKLAALLQDAERIAKLKGRPKSL
ncbi:hexosaminidase D-like isoform X4 [Brachyhypopomus gauderio]|uniref:hexosaminidase D-like isoform X4 n=1 Tax=Brachyhypopomus gauderio TaxID=698409 RepID=UPI004042BB92